MYTSLILNNRSNFIYLHDFQLLVLLPQFIECTFFVCADNKSSASKVTFRQATNCCKNVLEAVKLACANKTKEFIITQKFILHDFREIANNVLNKSKSVVLLLFDGPEVLSSASDKAKLFAENFSKDYNLDDSCMFLSIFTSRTNQKSTIFL